MTRKALGAVSLVEENDETTTRTLKTGLFSVSFNVQGQALGLRLQSPDDVFLMVSGVYAGLAAAYNQRPWLQQNGS